MNVPQHTADFIADFTDAMESRKPIPEAGSVFELSENDERHDQYHTLGFFRTKIEAQVEVEKHGVNLCEIATESQEFACVEIHEHRFGLHIRGQPVWSRKWVYDYEREHGDRWQVSELPNVQAQR